MRVIALFLLAIGFTAFAVLMDGAQAEHASHVVQAEGLPDVKDRRVLIVSIDGLRPDLCVGGKTPTLHALMDRGAYTMYAVTTDMAVTLPSHTSMLTGVPPNKHGVNWNSDKTRPLFAKPEYPTLFELAKKQGLTTALIAGKDKFNTLNIEGSLDWVFISDKTVKDSVVVKQAVRILDEHKPQVTLIHFPEVDSTGHKHGWGSDEQAEAIERVDAAVGKVLSVLKKHKLMATTMVIVTADHGGSGWTHGRADFRSRYIPWIVVGPGVVHQDLTLDRKLMIRTEDTFATACAWMGIPVVKEVDGRPVKQLYKKILKPVKK